MTKTCVTDNNTEETPPQSVSEFLAAGGKITECKPGESANIDAKKRYNPGPPALFTYDAKRGRWRPNT